MLRTLLKSLLALTLCLNGFGAPLAMAHSGASDAERYAAAQPSPCHEVATETVTSAADVVQVQDDFVGHSGKNHGAPCCDQGQCHCGCIASACLDFPAFATHSPPGAPLLRVALDAPFPVTRAAVLQRPPIR